MNRATRMGVVVLVGAGAMVSAGLNMVGGAVGTGLPAGGEVAERGPTKIEAVAFLAGSWSGDMGGAYVEETWTRPQGTSVLGTFRWLKKDGTPAMFEMLAITQEEDVVRLRMRHYSGTLAAKEEKDKPITMRLIDCEPTRAVFEAEKDAGDLAKVIYAVSGEELAIEVVFAQPTGEKAEQGARPPLKFKLKRTAL